jgi:hypothetical protein
LGAEHGDATLRGTEKAAAPWRQGLHSQNDEDGIIAEIFRRIGAKSKTFIEIGVGSGLENNTLALLVQGWRGLWIDANEVEIGQARSNLHPYIASGQLRVEQALITRDNVDSLVQTMGPAAEPDLLSIDIDGNDYYIWQVVQSITPRVVIVEYNATWFPPMSLSIAYQEQFQWRQNNYYGASLKALELLARRKRYRLVGCCFAGVNAFFVRADLCGRHFAKPYTAENHYEPPRYWMWHNAGHPAGIGPTERIDGSSAK